MSPSSPILLDRLRRRLSIRNTLLRNTLCEFCCTFFHIFIGSCVNCQNVLSHHEINGTIGVSLGWGFALIFAVMMGYEVSGAHLNPAVSFFQWTFGRIPFTHVVAYSIGQCAGAFVAAALTFVVYYGNWGTIGR